MSKDRTGLYLLVILSILYSCSAASDSEKAVKLLQQQIAAGAPK